MTKTALELHISGSTGSGWWARLDQIVVFLILSTCIFMLPANMSDKGGLGHHGVWTMFTTIALDFPMLDINMPP